jgi:hypothetical protein
MHVMELVTGESIGGDIIKDSKNCNHGREYKNRMGHPYDKFEREHHITRMYIFLVASLIVIAID